MQKNSFLKVRGIFLLVSKDKKNLETRGDKIAFFEQLSERKKNFYKNSLNKLRLSEQTNEGIKKFLYEH